MSTLKETGSKKPTRVRQNLDIPRDVDRYVARKLQIAIRQMDKLLASNPTQFNAKAYYDLLTQFAALAGKIKRDKKNDKTRVAEDRQSDSTQEVGEGTPTGLDAGVSAENPFTR